MKAIFEEIAMHLSQGTKAALCTVIYTEGSTPRKAGSKMLVFEDGKISGTIGGGSVEKEVIEKALTLLNKNESSKLVYELQDDLSMHCGGLMEVFVEPILANPSLFIFGAGHVGKAVGHFAKKVGFSVHFVDHREGIFNQQEFQEFQCFEGEYLEMIKKIPFNKNSYCVITTPQHRFDEDIAIALSAYDNAYLGMIGSIRKVELFRERCLNSKLLTQEQLSKIDMPIGIKFAAETPEEIAVSIVAKLIDVKNTNSKR